MSNLYLFENEIYDLFTKFDIQLPKYVFVPYEKINNNSLYQSILDKFSSYVVVKIVAENVFHKTKIGGIRFVKKEETKNAILDIIKNVKNVGITESQIKGFLVVDKVAYKTEGISPFYLVSISYLREFGYVYNFALGGTNTEVFSKYSKGAFVSFVVSQGDLKDKEKSKESLITFLSKVSWPFSNLTVKQQENIIDFFYKLNAILEDFESQGYIIEELEINPIVFDNIDNIIPLDGVLRFKEKQDTLLDTINYSDINLDELFFPKTIAILGVSSKSYNMGRIILNNIIDMGFDKNSLFVIKDGCDSIDGIKCVSSINEIPNISLLVLAIPADKAVDEVQKINNNVKNIIFIPGGLGETEQGKTLEKKLKEYIQKNNIPLVGGNCLGIVSIEGKLDTFFIPKEKLGYNYSKYYPYAFISQSGAFIISKVSKTGLVPKYAVSIGNQTGLKFSDYLEYFAQKQDIHTIALYIEGFKNLDGLKVFQIIKSTNKRVIIYKAGRTQYGQKAIGGHTASITSNYSISRDILVQSGAHITESLSDFENKLKIAMVFGEKSIAKPLNTFVISNAGFETVCASDNVKEDFVKLVSVEGIKEILQKHKLDSLVSVKNPLDLTPSAKDEVYIDIIRLLDKAPNVDFIILSIIPMTPALKSLPQEFDGTSVFEKVKTITTKPIVLVVDSGDNYLPAIHESKLISFRYIDDVLKSLYH